MCCVFCFCPQFLFKKNILQKYVFALERGAEADVGPYLKCLLISIFTQNWNYLLTYIESLPYPIFITIWQVF